MDTEVTALTHLHRVEGENVFLPKVSKKFPGAIALEPILKPFNKIDKPTKQHIVDLFATLRHIHKCGYLHRDLRQANIMQVEGHAYIIDLGFAIHIDEPESNLKGAVRTASTSVLEELKNPKDGFKYRTNDDFISLVKVRILLSLFLFVLLFFGGVVGRFATALIQL